MSQEPHKTTMPRFAKKLLKASLLLVVLFGALSVSSQSVSGGVSLVWETGLKTAPFYRGKALNVRNTPVTITAFPNVGVSANNLIYTWSEDGTVLGSKSGLGKRTLSLPGNIVGDHPFVTVAVANTTGTVLGTGSVEIPFSTPRTFIYEYDPTLGVLFEKAQQGTFTLANNEATFEVFPFFFSKARGDGLVYQWKLNSRVLPTELGPSLTVRKPEDASGDSLLKVSVRDGSEILQNAENSFRVTFE